MRGNIQVAKAAVTFLLLLLPAVAFAGDAISPGHIDWNGWSFDFEVMDEAGLAIRDVHFNGVRVLKKASLPVIRVQYDGDHCGPYEDKIENDKSCSGESIGIRCLLKISNCGNQFLCQQELTGGGDKWLELGILARIGDYRIYQVWYFGPDGIIDSHVFSSGVAAPINHRHHPYWRLDFDVVDSSNEVWEFEDDGPAEKVGNQIVSKKAAAPHKISVEGGSFKSKNIFGHTQNRRWFVKDPQTGSGVWVIPGAEDGTTDGFGKDDVQVRRYHSSQDGEWEFGAGGNLGYDNDENVESDVVFWYISHMTHTFYTGQSEESAEEHDHWLGSGPRLKVNSLPSIEILSPTAGENVGMGGLNIVTLKAKVTDVEDGAKCCLLEWKSDKDGVLGGSSDEVNTSFVTPGDRVITLTATDITGAKAKASVKVKVSNVAPKVKILKPTAGQKIFKNTPVLLEGSSSDPNEQFLSLPCSSLKWTIKKEGGATEELVSDIVVSDFPVSGCFTNVTFASVGTRTLKLTGKDSQGAIGTDSRVVTVTVAPSNSPPVVVIEKPPNNLRPDPNTPLTLKGKAVDPDGKSPLTFKWILKGVTQTETTLGNTATITWKPRDNVPFHCGGSTIQLCLVVTDPDGQTGSACVEITMDDPPC